MQHPPSMEFGGLCPDLDWGPFEATARSLCGGENRETKEQHKHRHIRWDVTF